MILFSIFPLPSLLVSLTARRRHIARRGRHVAVIDVYVAPGPSEPEQPREPREPEQPPREIAIVIIAVPSIPVPVPVSIPIGRPVVVVV